MMTRVKRGDHNHWPGSSACSSHLPHPALLQRVSIYQAKILKAENLRMKNQSSLLTSQFNLLKTPSKVDTKTL